MVRTGLATLLLVFLVPIVAAANVSTWGLRTALDSATFSTTVGRALDAPATERIVADALADGIIEHLHEATPSLESDLAQRLLARQLGLAANAGPDAVRAALRDELRNALQDPAVEQARDDVVATLHGYVLGVAEGEPGLVAVQGKNVVLDTPRILDRISDEADPRLAVLIDSMPSALSDPIVVAQAAELEPIGRALRAMDALQLLLPLLAVTMALLIVLFAHRRARALGIVAAAVAVAGLLSLIAVWAGGRYVAGVPDAPAARQLTSEVYDAFLRVLVAQSLILAIAGIALALVAWFVQVRDRRRATERMLGPR
jgi:hypothetical protein